MLITNYYYTQNICGHNHSGITNPIQFISPHTMRGYFGLSQVEETIEQNKRDSFPTGTNPPYSIMMGDKGSLLSSTTTITSNGIITSELSQGINIESNLTGVGTITDAQLSLIVQLASGLSSSGSITTASLVGLVSLASSISSTGSLDGGINVIAFMTSVLEGESNINAELKGILSLSADIYVNQSEAEVQQLVEGVWNALTVDYNTPGTMGEKMNDAGSASNPWTELIEGGYTAAECLRLLTAVAAGKTTIVSLGGGTATVTFRDINDTVDRIEIDMTDSERSSTTLDLN